MKELLTKNIFPFVNDDSFRAFFQAITEGILIADQRGKILLANKSAEKMFGYVDGDLAGTHVEELVPSEHRRSHGKDLDRYLSNPQSNQMGGGRDLEGVRKDGSQFPVEVKLSYHKEDSQVFVTAFITNISARKKAEKAMMNERETAKQYFEVAQAMLMVLDLEGRIVEINRKGCEVLGYAENELIGKDWFSISIGACESERIKKVFAGVLKQEGEFQTHDNHVVTKTGEKKLIHWQNTVLKNKDGEVTGTLSSGTDVTERNRIMSALEESEAKLKAYSSDLEAQVEQRTKELEEALANEKELGELKSKFVSLASHEFRTPLSAILSSASLVARYTTEELNDKRIKHVNRIKSSVVHLTGILDDFLSVDKLEEGKISCSPEEFDLSEMFDEVKASLKEIGKKDQTLVFSCDSKVPMLFTDKKLVRNILINLTSNAIKYSPEGKPINVSAQLNGNNVICRVQDEGIGIPEEDHDRLFQRFFRANNAQRFQGTGLGLNIVKRYVDLLGGEISFESSRGNGTTFQVEFPINH